MTRDTAEVVELEELRRRRESRTLARSLALIEAAKELARRGEPALVALVERAFGDGYLARRVETLLKQKEEPVARPRRRRSTEPRG